MQTVAGLGKRRFSDIQEMRLLSHWSSRHPFDDVRDDGTCCTSQLRGQLEAFIGGEPASNQMMQLDEEIVSTSKGDQVLVSSGHGLSPAIDMPAPMRSHQPCLQSKSLPLPGPPGLPGLLRHPHPPHARSWDSDADACDCA